MRAVITEIFTLRGDLIHFLYQSLSQMHAHIGVACSLSMDTQLYLSSIFTFNQL